MILTGRYPRHAPQTRLQMRRDASRGLDAELFQGLYDGVLPPLLVGAPSGERHGSRNVPPCIVILRVCASCRPFAPGRRLRVSPNYCTTVGCLYRRLDQKHTVDASTVEAVVQVIRQESVSALSNWPYSIVPLRCPFLCCEGRLQHRAREVVRERVS